MPEFRPLASIPSEVSESVSTDRATWTLDHYDGEEWQRYDPNPLIAADVLDAFEPGDSEAGEVLALEPEESHVTGGGAAPMLRFWRNAGASCSCGGSGWTPGCPEDDPCPEHRGDGES